MAALAFLLIRHPGLSAFALVAVRFGDFLLGATVAFGDFSRFLAAAVSFLSLGLLLGGLGCLFGTAGPGGFGLVGVLTKGGCG